jgi:serine phosphatase RsbU (regulator of sigma subunit)
MSEVINKNIVNIKNNIQQDNILLQETLKIIDTISNGNLKTKLESQSNNPELNSLKLEINEMLGILQEKVGLDINRIVEVMQAYQAMNFEEKIVSPKGTIENKVNEMGQSIYTQQQKIFAQNQEILRQKNEVEDFNKQLQSSVQAALTIQQAVFPYQTKLAKLLKNYFIFSRPRDVVSGDFYWLNEINGKTLLIVGDCTGHGIPGAFMTLIGCTLLDKIVRVWDITEPNLILARLHEEIRTVLRQEETNNYNGMDVAVMLLEKLPQSQTKITFSGAKNGFYFVLKENPNVIEEIKGSRKGIGGIQNKNISFDTHELVLPKDSWIYAGTDGYADQCNPERKKFNNSNLKEMILQASRFEAKEQETFFSNNLNQFQKNALQRDDILWIGVKV